MNQRHQELHRLFSAIRAMNQRNRTVVNLYGFSRSLAEAHATVEVAASPGIQPSLLAKRLGLTEVTMARVLAVAFREGLLRWKPSPNDGRIKQLYPGPKAEKLLSQNLERNTATFGAAYERLSSQGRRKFHSYFTLLCDRWPAPPASAMSHEPPLMMEVRRLTRAIGLLEEKLAFAEWCSPLKWHVLTLIREAGTKGISSAVLSSSLAAPIKAIEALLRLLKRQALIRCGRRTKGAQALSVYILPKGATQLRELEDAACTIFARCLETLRDEQISEFADLWEQYAGKFVTPMVQAITKGTILEFIEKPSTKSAARRFVYEQRVKQKLLRDVPPTIIGEGSAVFVLNRFRNITAVVDLVHEGEGDWRATHFIIDQNQVSLNTVRQLIPIFLQNAFLMTSAKRIIFEKLQTSHDVWGVLAGKKHQGDERISFSLGQ